MDNTNSSKGFNPMFIVIGVVVLALVGVGFLFLGNKSSSNTTAVPTPDMNSNSALSAATPEPTMDTTTSATNSAESSMADETGVKEFVLEAGSFYFKPNVIRVKTGDKVKVTINAVSMMHNFEIEELNVKIPVTQNGKSNSVEFTAPSKPGTYQFFCDVGNHRQQGQVGTFIVE